jgi:hypothetical protein
MEGVRLSDHDKAWHDGAQLSFGFLTRLSEDVR